MVCSGVIAAAGLALTLASAEPLVFATEAPFPPYTLVNEAGEAMGLSAMSATRSVPAPG